MRKTDSIPHTKSEYFSFVDNQLFAELLESKKYVLYYELEEKAMKKGKEQGISEGIKEGLKIGVVKGKREGEKKRIIKGRTEGKKEEKIEIAKKMLSKGVDKNSVADFTGLTKAQISKLGNG